ncbi:MULTISPECIES: SMI1/KNR4 family protein [Peribacillus]|uniref:Uncharacterized protein n=1 Tax=Peribacillus simplex TaxID=1478 RepID=A0A9W4PBP1_9BACI|nr:SMI1/KNR4 family protein [Peribacillus simplex]MDR4927120.1 SMI1/KNR4 family protein [Peribacillus simplex]WHX92406.1 SMI1/KNR4 family protein [Peribacillus simplex]CAH0159707.1 hypothetical protein SRABI133_00917 [Peribacillus simplex]
MVESTERYRKLGLPVIENVDEFVYCLRIIDEYFGVQSDDISKIELNRYKNLE